MKLTLDYIAEYLGAHVECETAFNSERMYSRALLGDRSATVPGPQTLYVVSEAPTPEQLATECGFVFVGQDFRSSGWCGAEVVVVSDGREIASVLNSLTLLFERHTMWELKLSSFSSVPDGMQRACDYFYEELGYPSYCVDDGFKVLAIRGDVDTYESGYVWKHLVDDGYLPWSVVEALVEKNEIAVMESANIATLVDISSFNTPFISLPIRNKDKLLGYFFVVGLSRRLGRHDVELVNALAPILVSTFMNTASIALLRGERYESFLRDLVLGEALGRETIQRRSLLLNLKPDGDYLACFFDTRGKHDLVRNEILRTLDADSTCLTLLFGEMVFALYVLSDRASTASAQKRIAQIAKHTKSKVGVSERFSGIGNVKTYYRQAKLAVEQAREVELVCFEDLYFPSLADALDDFEGDLNVFVNRDALALAKYDRRYGTDYSATFLRYAINGCNSVRTAQALHIHRSTLTYRLEKIKDICSFDFGDRSKLLATALSIYLLNSKSA